MQSIIQRDRALEGGLGVMVCAHGNCYSSIPVDLTAALLLELVWVQ